MKINVTKNAIKNVTNKFLMMFFLFYTWILYWKALNRKKVCLNEYKNNRSL